MSLELQTCIQQFFQCFLQISSIHLKVNLSKTELLMIFPLKSTLPTAYSSQILQGFGRPSVYHAAIVIFLEFFAWGLLTTPVLTVLHETFSQHTFLMNGLIQGVKGLLSFLSAPLIGALSDVWGRKPFLLGTVFFTCFPIPLMRISPCFLKKKTHQWT
ncbi:major facilitator superfamily domain-containing 14C-like isoform X2 [Pan troglodytes]|uniref:major facilitator superfamily domain-containing 14C-like isoform X2 n=2 Tax=Pan troglodytes TaxID=9598 RepID=UPI0030139744